MLTEILLFILTFIFGYIYYKYKGNHKYFESNGIKFKPGLPIFGNSYNTFMNKSNLVEDIDDVYFAFPEERYVAYFDGTVPAILIRDPELIKTITVKDFDHFINRKDFFTESDKLFGASLLAFKDEKWRQMRSSLSPAFTGTKMKFMLPFMLKNSKNLVEYLKENLKKNDDMVDVCDVMRRYTNDVIASSAFGLEVDSFKEKNNKFFTTGQTLFTFNFWQRLVLYFGTHFPVLSKKLQLQLLPNETVNFFDTVVSNTMEYRKKNNVERPDMIQLMMETPKDFSARDIIGQAFTFYFGGFDTSASTLTMIIHELALNPDCQEKLYQEIKEFDELNSGFSYDKLNEMKYLNNVINETTRKWSIAIVLDRTCTKAYELPPPREGGKPFKVRPGDVIYNTVNSIHWDPQYYPEPEKFDPERFSDENKQNIQPFTFMPFGMGPRSCIGTRFAQLDLKVLVYYFVLNFKINKCEKTLDPIRLVPGFSIKARGGTFVKLEARN